jgi:8-oxo-dGTP diphosphatase
VTAAPGDIAEVVAAVIERDGHILLTRRREGTHLAGLWEFPGGKRRPGEDPAEALRREIREELGAELVVGEEIERLDWDYPEKRVRLCFFRCTLRGEARPLEGQEMAWVPRADLGRYELPAADAVLVERLRLG